LGENYTIYFQKGKKKLDVNFIFWENFMISKNLLGDAVLNTAPAIEEKKRPVSVIYKTINCFPAIGVIIDMYRFII
jgi:hypothetical protein